MEKTLIIPDFINALDLPLVQRCLLAQVLALCDESGCCKATNEALAEALGVPVRTVKRDLKALVERGHLVRDGGQTRGRKLHIAEPLTESIRARLARINSSLGPDWPESTDALARNLCQIGPNAIAYYNAICAKLARMPSCTNAQFVPNWPESNGVKPEKAHHLSEKASHSGQIGPNESVSTYYTNSSKSNRLYNSTDIKKGESEKSETAKPAKKAQPKKAGPQPSDFDRESAKAFRALFTDWGAAQTGSQDAQHLRKLRQAVAKTVDDANQAEEVIRSLYRYLKQRGPAQHGNFQTEILSCSSLYSKITKLQAEIRRYESAHHAKPGQQPARFDPNRRLAQLTGRQQPPAPAQAEPQASGLFSADGQDG